MSPKSSSALARAPAELVVPDDVAGGGVDPTAGGEADPEQDAALRPAAEEAGERVRCPLQDAHRAGAAVRQHLLGQHPATQVGETDGGVRDSDVDSGGHVPAVVDVDRYVRTPEVGLWRTRRQLADQVPRREVLAQPGHSGGGEAGAAGNRAAGHRAGVQDGPQDRRGVRAAAVHLRRKRARGGGTGRSG
jgi:hypothetical protein